MAPAAACCPGAWSGPGQDWCGCAAASAPHPGPGLKKKVSCISRAGCFGGKFSAVKLWKSSSMSGPSARLKPISAKTAIISSITCMIGWTHPVRRGGAGQGQVERAGGEFGVKLRRFPDTLASARRSAPVDAVAQAVDQPDPGLLPLVRRHSAEGLQESVEIRARLAEKFDAQKGIKRRQVTNIRPATRRQNVVFHAHGGIAPCCFEHLRPGGRGRAAPAPPQAGSGEGLRLREQLQSAPVIFPRVRWRGPLSSV